MIVLFFARARDLAETDRAEFSVAPPTVGVLRVQLTARYPKLAGLIEKSAFAINGEFAGEEALLKDTDEVALLPPVSGG